MGQQRGLAYVQDVCDQAVYKKRSKSGLVLSLEDDFLADWL